MLTQHNLTQRVVLTQTCVDSNGLLLWGDLELICYRELLVGGLPLLLDVPGSREEVEGRREWEIERNHLKKSISSVL